MTLQDQQPLVSVIVPAYNAEATLAETLASVAAQSYGNLEIVIVNDGSTDGTPHIASGFAAVDRRARVLSIDNGGVATARNRGIAASSGAFIAPIDADDLWHPDYLLKLVRQMLAAHPTAVFAYAACRLIDADANIIGNGANANAEGFVVYRMLYCNLVGNGSGMVIRRAAIEAAGGYDRRLHEAGCQGHEDYLLQLMLAAQGPVCAVGEYLVGYRQGAAAMSRDIGRMEASGRLARRLHAAAIAVDPPRWLQRWIRAHGLLLAANAAERADRAAWFLVRAVLIDPVATGAAIATRLGSLMGRYGRDPVTGAVHFFDVDPVKPDGGGKLGPQSSPGLFGRMQIRRLKRVAALERPEPASPDDVRRRRLLASERAPDGRGPARPYDRRDRGADRGRSRQN